MSRVVISGYYGFGNAGDEAMLRAIITALRHEEPEIHITVISGNPKETAAKHSVDSVSRLAGLSIMKALSQCDLLISGGGSLLQDATSIRNTFYYLSIMAMAKILGKKVMLYAQGIGPLCRSITRKAVSRVLQDVDYITVRDNISRDELLTLGVTKPTIEVTADAVLAMERIQTDIGNSILQEAGVDTNQPIIGIAVRSWKEHTAYRTELAKAMTALQAEQPVTVVFIPMSHPLDTEEAKAIVAQMPKGAVLLERSFTTEEFISLSGAVDIMIGIRLHALVFSSLMGKPVIGISYDPKIKSFLHMIGEDPIGLISDLDGQALYERTKLLLQSVESYEDTFTRIQYLQQQSSKNASIACSLLSR